MSTEHEVYNRIMSRQDVWAQQATKPDDKGRYGYFTKKVKLTRKDIDDSMLGNKKTIGAYIVNPDGNTCTNPQIDIDNHDGKTNVREIVLKVFNELKRIGLHPYIEASSGELDQGAHVGEICKPTAAKVCKEVLDNVLRVLDLKGHEVFPKQTEVNPDSFGSLVKLPFQYNNRTKQRSQIINPETLEPFSRQDAINYLMALQDSVFEVKKDIETPIQPVNEAPKASSEDVSFDSAFGLSDIKPCVKACFDEKWVLHGKGDEGHNFRIAIAGNLLYNGATEQQIHDYFMLQSDYSKKTTNKQIKSIKEYLSEGKKPMGCKKIKEKCSKLLKGICETCEKNPIEKKEKTEGKKKEIKEQFDDEPETPQHIKDKAKEIMEKGDPVKFIFETHQKEHVGDELISKTLIVGVGCQSANNTSGIQPKLDGASGKGKSHSAKAFMKFIPNSHKIEGSCSDKVLYYQHDMKDGTVIYSDDISISEDMTGTIKRATTNFQDVTAHHTLNKDRVPEKHTLPKRIMWLLTSVENNQSMQLLNRQFGGSVDESAKQDENVFDYQVMNGMLGKVEFSESDDVLVCKEIIKDIKTHVFTVVIPYSYLIEWKNKDNRRNFTMFTDMIAGFTIYRYKQRIVEGDYLFADLKDFDDAEQLYSNRNVQQRTKLTDTELKICNYLATVEDADVKKIQENTGLTPTRISQLMNGKTDTDTGLLFKVKGLSVEDVNLPVEINSTQGKEREDNDDEYKKYKEVKTVIARKKIYTLTGFNYNEYKESVVSIGDRERGEFNRLNPVLTPTLLLKIKNSGELLTYLTKFNNIHSNKKYEDRLKKILFSSHICKPENEVKMVNNSQPIVYLPGLRRGKVGSDDRLNTSTDSETGKVKSQNKKAETKDLSQQDNKTQPITKVMATQHQNTVTELTKLINEAGEQFMKENGAINSSNIDKFSFSFCKQYKPKWNHNGESGEYLSSNIRGIASKIFKLTPAPSQEV